MILRTADILANQAKKIILIVEDGNINFLLLKKIIQRVATFDCEIFRAENGKIAVDFCKENFKLDLILMDIEMPIMNGFDATRAIKKILPDVPIVAQTAYTSSENREKAEEVGCSDFIAKPIRLERIVSVLGKYIPKA